ncbi:LmbU family transcriptional regulator [Streptomyces albiaxialis]|uniref:LmbU family transcriptional regulator n=1 Tax=Streptomyces albiaxialis TaxID=329523 RepID=UPI0031D7F44C
MLKRRTSLSFPRAIPLDTWIALGQEIFVVADASAWWLGDWLIYGQNRYPDRYRRAIEASALHYKTLRNYAWVARKFEVSRRRDTLSLQHHGEVAALPHDDQEAWLDRAERLNWSVSELRRRVKASRIGPVAGPAGGSATVTVKAPAEQMRRWQDAASRVGSTLDEWIQRVLDREAVELLDPGQLMAAAPQLSPS